MVANSTAQSVKKRNFQSRVKMVKSVKVLKYYAEKSCYLFGTSELHLTLQ
jgi:hypothetical protein